MPTSPFDWLRLSKTDFRPRVAKIKTLWPAPFLPAWMDRARKLFSKEAAKQKDNQDKK